MFTRIIVCLALATIARAEPPIATADPRVEAVSIVFRLAGYPEYNQGRAEAYIADVEEHFDPYSDHEMVRYAGELRAAQGISYDACMSYAIHLDVKDHTFVPRVPFDQADSLEHRWTPESADKFTDLLNKFVEDTGFWSFYDDHADFYESCSAPMTTLLAEQFDPGWYERFFGREAHGSFELIMAPINGPANYGPKFVDDAGEHDYAIIGVWQFDKDGNPAADSSVLPTVIHEYCHSFVNFRVDEHADELEPIGERLFSLVEQQMRQQAYSNWRTMMYESLVRAGVTRYLAEHAPDAVEADITDNTAHGFLWQRGLVDLLGEYEADRKTYTTFDGFMPRVVSFFNEQPELVRAQLAERDADRPSVVSITPTNGADDVDPAITEIVIVFDRPMGKGYGFMISPELGRDAFPKTTGHSHFSDDMMSITLPVALEPGKTYEFYLNNADYAAFQSAKGSPLEPVRVRFTTAAN